MLVHLVVHCWSTLWYTADTVLVYPVVHRVYQHDKPRVRAGESSESGFKINKANFESGRLLLLLALRTLLPCSHSFPLSLSSCLTLGSTQPLHRSFGRTRPRQTQTPQTDRDARHHTGPGHCWPASTRSGMHRVNTRVESARGSRELIIVNVAVSSNLWPWLGLAWRVASKTSWAKGAISLSVVGHVYNLLFSNDRNIQFINELFRPV